MSAEHEPYIPTFEPTMEEVDRILSYLEERGKVEKNQYTLERMEKAMASLGSPQDDMVTVHIAGTSGKGSTAAFVESILRHSSTQEHPVTVGLYTSPALAHPLDRIRINQRHITPEECIAVLKQLWPAIQAFHLSYFETFTAIAFLWFSQQQVSYAVLETGMGGRLDATNVSPSHIALLTDIGLDHTKQLGDTKEAIAIEKQGIIKAGSLALTISPYATQAALVPVEDAEITDRSITGTSFRYHGEEYTMQLLGDFQVRNAVLAIEAARALMIPAEAILEGVAKASNPGRMQVIQQDPLMIVDGAHNPQKMTAFASALDTLLQDDAAYSGKRVALLALKADKAIHDTLKPLMQVIDEVVLTQFDGASHKPELLAEEVQAIATALHKTITVHIEPDAAKAHDYWQAKIEKDGVGIITGSLYLIGQLAEQKIIAL